MTTTYLSTELRRTFRNPRYVLFTLGIPVILFLVIGSAFDTRTGGVSGQTWYMVNMGLFGAMSAVLGTGARISVERDAGWNRQLRLTPLPPLGYVLGKVVTGMLLALPALLLVDIAGRLTGDVHLSAVQWGAGPRPGLGRGAAVGRRRSGHRLPLARRQCAGRQWRSRDADVDVRRALVPDRRQCAGSGCSPWRT